MIDLKTSKRKIEKIVSDMQYRELRKKILNEIKNQISFLHKIYESKKIRTQLSCINSLRKFILKTDTITPEDYDVILNYLAIQVGSVLNDSY